MNKSYAKLCIASFFALAVSGCGQGSGTSAQSSVSFSQNPIVLTRGSAANVIPVYTGEQKPIACKATPALPEGLVLNPDCSISGTPVAPAAQTAYVLQATYQPGPRLSFGRPPIQPISVFQASLEVAPAHIYIGSPSTNDDQGAFYECNTDGKQCRQISLPAIQTKANKVSYFGALLSANQFGVFVSAPDLREDPDVDSAVYRCSFPIESTSCSRLDLPSTQDTFLGATVFATHDAVFVGDGKSNIYKCNADGTHCGLFKTIDGFAQTIFVTNQNILLSNKNIFLAGSETSEVKKCDLEGNNCNTIATGNGNTRDLFGSRLLLTENTLYIGAPTNGIYLNKGTIYKCNIDGSNCAIFPTSFEPELPTNALFGTSLAIHDENLYSVNFINGQIFKCNLNNGACAEFKTDVTDQQTAFGSSLAFF